MNEILALPMDENDADAETIGDYLVKLLLTLWLEGEGFNGKRPFGNSGWQLELYHALVRGNIVKGRIDEDGYIVDYDTKTADALIEKAIISLWKGNQNASN